MSECGFRIYRGSWYLGPCSKPAGHVGSHDLYTEAVHVERESMALFGAPKVGDLALFDGWTVWPFDKHDSLSVAMTQIYGISVYEWNGDAWVKTVVPPSE